METTRNLRLAAAGAIVALAAAGAAFGAVKLKDGAHTGSAGPPGSFVSSGSGSSSSGSSADPRPWHRFGGRSGAGTPGGPFGDHGGDLAAAATYLGISQSDLMTQLRTGKTLAQVAEATSGKTAGGLVNALVAVAQAQLAQAVTDGKLTRAQADRIQQDLKQRTTDRVNHTGPGPGDRHHGPDDALAAAATYLGSSQTDLMTQLRSGKTIGEIADGTAGKSKSGLVSALVAQEKNELAQAVKDGRLTQAQADRVTAGLEDRITHLVDGDFPRRPDGPPPTPSPGDDASA
ncbi:MAG TPA: hypothetical protein VFI04_03195 [Gaiellaceae bacterium]|nr:hypothetical protein [Gaiellaceae bacterium]